MNKQQLASKIWESANKMRSKIEANEYKDYILGFMFYKFLSDKESDQLKKEGWTEENMQEMFHATLKLANDWEQRKLGEIAIEVNRTDANSSRRLNNRHSTYMAC